MGLFVKPLVAASYPDQLLGSPSLAQGPAEEHWEELLDGPRIQIVQDCSSSWEKKAFPEPLEGLPERAEETNDDKQRVFVNVTSNGPV